MGYENGSKKGVNPYQFDSSCGAMLRHVEGKTPRGTYISVSSPRVVMNEYLPEVDE